jgi:hypothetical protein
VYSAGDWFTTNLRTGRSSYVSSKVDPQSSEIISNFDTAYSSPQFNVNGTSVSVPSNAVVNRATYLTRTYTVSGTRILNDRYNDDPSNTVPWSNVFIIGGSEHAIVLNTQTCVTWELYGPRWNRASLSAANGYVHNLHYAFDTQYETDSNYITRAGIPMLGTLDVGEDAFAPSINHIAYMLIPGSDNNSIAAGGYVAPATSGARCVRFCAHPLPFGARLLLNATKYTCPNARYYPQANKICVQLETYGAIIVDHDGVDTYQIRLSETANGTNPWDASDVAALNGIPITDWDVMSLGTVRE